MTDEVGGTDLSDLLTKVGGIVWPLVPADGGRVCPSVVDDALRELTPGMRLLAALVLDVGAAIADGATREAVLGRLAVLGQGEVNATAAPLASVAAQGLRRVLTTYPSEARPSTQWVDGLYATLEAHTGLLADGAGLSSDARDRRVLLASLIALSGRLPLGLDGAEALLKHGEDALAIAVGGAARSGDPGARATLRDALVVDGTPQRVALALLFGLGGGLFDRGLATLTGLARGAVVEQAKWALALQRGAIALARCVGTQDEAQSGRWIPSLLETLALVGDADQGIAFIEALPDALQAEVVALARRALASRPPAARAAVARLHLKQTLFFARAPDGGADADLLRERSTPVLLLVLDLIGRLGDALPPELRTALGRAWSDHPDVAVRRALATTIAPKGLPPHGAESHAEVIALPPAALARDDLDRLRAALWAGEPEHIVELATCVPLDRRAPARESLLQALEIPNAPLRRAIVEAIGRIGGQADGPRLIEAAKRYRALEGTVAAALRELGARGMAEALAEIYRRRLKWADDDAVDDYCAIAGPEQVMHLMQALETRYYPSARAGAARAIARRRAAEVVFALRTAALSDTQDSARLAALGALHELTGSGPSGDEIAGHALLFRATDELPDTIERAREAGPAALNGIRRTIARGSWKRRRAACEVLATLPGPEATAVLVEVLEDPDEDVRLAAIEALQQRGWVPTSGREVTLRALASRRIREACEGAELDLIDPPTLIAALGLGGHVFRAEVLEALAELVIQRPYRPTEEELGVIAAARMDVATAMRLPRGLDAVLRAIDHTWQANPHRARFVRELGAVPTEALVAQLDNDVVMPGRAGAPPGWSWRAREAIAQALERTDDALALEGLGRLLLEDDDDVRRAALQSLAWIGTEDAAAEVARGLQSPFQEDRELVAKTLGTFGPRALGVLQALMSDAWWESRQGAALALGHWRVDVQGAVDRLIALAVDPEYRVAQAARDALTTHGLLPTTAALCEALGRAQSLTLEGLEPWLGLHRSPSAPPEIADRLDAMIEELPADALPQRLGLIATFRAEHLALWLEEVALGRGDPDAAMSRHVGVRLSAADALRALIRCACPVCLGEGTVRCPGCNGAGDVACAQCQGRGTVLIACPDPECTARGTLRRIDSRRCPTCRGRGEIAAPCACEGGRGRVPCLLCKAGGRLVCSACDGTGNSHALGSSGSG